MSQTPEVIQGRLGIESGDVTELSPGELEPHPKNAEIYGDTETVEDLPETFIESVREKGVLEPLVITDGKQIISGHRRWLAAKHVGVGTVPVRKTSFEDDLTEREALIEFNRQREKTPGQVVNEFEEMLEIEELRDRQGERTDLQDTPGNISGSYQSETRERAAEKVNADVSGRTLEKGKKVKDKAESDDEPEEIREAAQEAWEGLQNGDESFHGAYQTVKDAEKDAAGETDTDTDDDHTVVDAATKQETDEWSSPRELVEPLAETVGGFDLDPCSGAEQSPFAAETYTEDDDGLAQPWHGTVWVNPPYSEMADWTGKAIAEADRDATDAVYYLCKGDSSTDWWHDALEAASVVVAIDHRLSFGDGGNSAPFASHIFAFGTPGSDELEALADHGAVLTELQVAGGGSDD